ncbi:MAG: DUF805 domain-containing protein [Bacteroidetes bacterium]|nr:DUF805 domain-containing protein [Bacteroidota bacterium]
MNWYLQAIKKYTDFFGRAIRKEYWMFTLLNIIFAIATMALDNILGTTEISYAHNGYWWDYGYQYGLFYILYGLFIFIPSIAVTVRRLHDTDRSGWWILIALIPIIGVIWLLILMLMDSQPGSNKYGPSPKEIITTPQHI